MKWPFNKKKQVAIRINKTYDSVAYTPTYKIITEEEAGTIINHINNHPLVYREAIKKQDQLTYLPKLQIKEINEVYPADNNIPTIAEIHYTYTTKIPEQEIKILPGFWKAISLVALATIVIGILSIIVLQHQHEQNMINDACYMYFKEGSPTSIEVEGTKYNINEDGTMDDIDALFLNPWHRELIMYDKCIKVNTQ